ncbi:hypothetical protein [Deinococcus sonorensis]|uniref:Uncharacterized protein n=2 Tax=Deinococcus sonorensis TaxID=309891 RepID=A0AAU7UGJ7_9DEIO
MPTPSSLRRSLLLVLSLSVGAPALAATFVATSPTPMLLQYTEAQGRILGQLESTVFTNTTIKQVYRLDVDGIRNAGEISLRLMDRGGNVENVYGTLKGTQLTLFVENKQLQLHQGSAQEYQKAVAVLQARADAASRAAAQAQHQADAQANAAARQRAATAAAQVKAVKPAYDEAQGRMKNLEANLDRLYQALYTLPDVGDPEELAGTVSNIKDNPDNCDAVAAFQDAHVGDLIQQASKGIGLLQPSIDDLKSRFSATQQAVSKANALVKQNPLSNYAPLSLKDSEAPDFLEKMGEEVTFYKDVVKQYTGLQASFTQLAKTSACIAH